jgi:hypothetical protein
VTVTLVRPSLFLCSHFYRMTANASTSTRGCPVVPNTLTWSVWVPAEDQDLIKTSLRHFVVFEYRSTVITLTPSIHTSALPYFLSLDAIQAMLLPVKVILALAP